ncbi:MULTISPECIES: reverse transcriptase family protein [Bradyrhizobium]|uniref:reverse transcriptase family protein n=1 Tax=Bradyrhizobium TaxID=374 RepID=UPI000688272D|nr:MULTISPECIES: reverse transcriptase family protein [unclassified Bradyrhizobium]MDA9427112.1 hypothetical protein [Bradyrhizobium sp. CCBAU 53380]
MPSNEKRYPLDQSPLFRLKRRAKLAQLLGISDRELRWLTRNADTLYREKDRPKKNGSGLRHIEDPQRPLKKVQSSLAQLLSRIDPPDFLFCPVKGRDYIQNAAQHRGNRVVRCLDIHKYFPSTKSRRVFWFFDKVLRCERDLAGTLTRLSCYREHLPTGSPLSPILSYFAHLDVWSSVAQTCKAHDCVLTVYIDDVTVSGENVSESMMWEIRQTIHRAGLRYHKEKLYVERPAEITGVIVDGKTLMPPHRQHKKIRVGEASLKVEKKPFLAQKISGQLLGLRGQIEQIRLKSKMPQPIG